MRRSMVQQGATRPTLRSKLASTVLVFAIPLLLLAVMAVFGGLLGFGSAEIGLLSLIWIVGLTWVWRPRSTDARS